MNIDLITYTILPISLTIIGFIIYVIALVAHMADLVTISPWLHQYLVYPIKRKFFNNFWDTISDNCCFIIPAHPKKRISTSIESKGNTGTGYNDCIAAGRLSQYIYSIVKYQIPIYEVGKSNESEISIWKEENDTGFSFNFQKTDIRIELSNILDKKNFILIGGPESNIISKILFNDYIKEGPKFERNNVILKEKTIIDSNDKEYNEVYGDVLLYCLSFNGIDTKKKRIMMIAGCHGPDTRIIINHLQQKDIIKKIDSLIKKHDFMCCISIKYNKKNNSIENIDDHIKDYQIEVKN